MFIELTNSYDGASVFIEISSILRMHQLIKGTKLVLSDGENLNVVENASEIHRELKDKEEALNDMPELY